MKKIIIAGAAVVVLGVAYWLISPLFITTVSNETMSDLPSAGIGSMVVSRGQVQDGGPGHHASGEALLLKNADGSYAVRFEDNFAVTNGPDVFVYFGKDGQYDSNARLSGLKGSMGGQNYVVPAGIDATQYNEV